MNTSTDTKAARLHAVIDLCIDLWDAQDSNDSVWEQEVTDKLIAAGLSKTKIARFLPALAVIKRFV